MYVNAWLIGEGTEDILDDLMAPDGIPPASTWIPLESAHEGTPAGMPKFRDDSSDPFDDPPCADAGVPGGLAWVAQQ